MTMRKLVAGALVLAGSVAGLTAGPSPALAQPAVPAQSAPADALTLTPPMGFNDWNAFGCNVSEDLITATADLFVSSGLQAAGYSYVNIDDCWMTAARDADGRLVPDPVKFPHGMAWLADHVHAKGLKIGIYESAGTRTCAGYPGSLGHEQIDAQTFADWGIDLLKYDNCYHNGDTTKEQYIARYTAMQTALADTGRPIVYSLCEWGTMQPWTWEPKVGQLWRTTGDIADNWASLKSIIRGNLPLYPYGGPSRWNDPDMLQVGNGGMSDVEYRTHFGMWSMMAAPLLIGTDLREASPETMRILLNRDLIAIDQDPLGRPAQPVLDEAGRVVLTRPLANGDTAVALYNETDTSTQITASAAKLGLPRAAGYTLRDVWSGAITQAADTISAVVPPHGTAIYRVRRTAHPTRYAPDTTVALALPQATEVAGQLLVQPGDETAVTATFGNFGRGSVRAVVTQVRAPSGWTVSPGSAARTRAVPTNGTFAARWTVRPPAAVTPGTYDLVTTATYRWGRHHRPATRTSTLTVLVASPPPPGTSYLSDRSWLSAVNAWGPVEKDRSNGEQAAGDGGPLTVNGVVFAKGLGTNAPSDIAYFTGGACTTVTAQVGIDDEKSVNANATFQVFADARKVADSGPLTFADDARALTADITAADVVHLVVADNGSADSDHADWGDLKITCS
jgi:alpha-galactosidase